MFELHTIHKVSLKIYDNQGRLVKSLLDNTMHAGKHSLIWDGKNASGEQVGSGVYYYVLRTVDFKTTRKMTLIR